MMHRRAGQVLRCVGFGFRLVRMCSSGVQGDILGVLGDRDSVAVEEVARQLNLPTAELDAAIAALEAKQVYRYRRRGQWDMLVRSPETVVSRIFEKHAPQSLLLEVSDLRKDLEGLQASLSNMEAIKQRCDAIASKHPDHFANFGLLGMSGLWFLLFWMVFAEPVFGCETFAFDWNLVEPITYFLGYSIVWFGVVFYYFTGQEYTYDNVRDMMAQKKREALYARENFDLVKYEDLKKRVSVHERKLAELSALQPKASDA